MIPAPYLAALGQLPGLLASHVLLSAAALGLALVLGLPLALAAARRPVLAQVALGFASLVQTIPGLALLALFYPLLLGLSALVGGGIPALGFLPSLLALTLYALLPILRTAITGLRGLDPAVIEAADGIGMTPGQKLRLVEAPLAAPVAMAGIRTAAVWTIGAATLATTVGQPSLGNLIFAGLQTEAISLVLAGCIGAAALALAVDGLLALVEKGIATRRRALILPPLMVIALGLAAAAWPLVAPREQVVTIGAKTFSEQYTLARLIGHRLEAAGYRVRYKEGLGSAVAYRALAGGDVDVYVDYSGTLWTTLMARRDIPPRAAMIAGVAQWMKREAGTALIGPLGFENAYALVARPASGLTSIADLTARAPSLRLAGDLEFLDRPEWRAVRDAYGLRFADTRAYSPTFMYRALGSGRADVISAFSSDGRIAADRLTVLADPRRALPSYDALLLVSPARANDARFRAALQPLVGAIPVSAMREANYMVDRDTAKVTPDDAARWLAKRIGR
ncbi:ABC transporter permease/substrate-binding protein [Sphingomonas solaris]|uniref:ABC transporter permease subunit n=1 Tax=Alterirhizorhabdus solaris TaxID=2529389 RepID=A0A558QW39_9SPHN|nr:ABC transporter permease/substrate-binding protein [Sphingomonas solaris]TVV71282.1 ABC transporter permease subunit [Sphingomonas solaris]